MAQQYSQENRSLHKAARLLFSGNDKPSRMLRDLCEHLVDIDGATLKVSEAAQLVAGLPTSTAALMQLMQDRSCFSVQGTPSSNLVIKLDVKALLQLAKQATATGILRDELPPPAGYAFGLYPIRPGQRACAHFTKTGSCGFGRNCVYTHPVSSMTDILPHYRGSSDGGSTHSSGAAASASSNGAAHHAAAGMRQQPHQQHQQQQQQQQVALSPPFVFPQQQHFLQPPPFQFQQQQQQQQQPAAAARLSSAGPIRPGQPGCFMLRTRGFCTAGPGCPYDHTAAAAAATAAGGCASSSDMPPQQQQQQQQQHPPAGSAAALKLKAAAAAAASSLAAAAAAAGWPYPRSPEQQQLLLERQRAFIQQQQQQQHGGLQGFAYPVIGSLPGGYPQRPGAANCPFYLYSGDCKFKKGCVYHHPDVVALPERFVLTGGMSARWPQHERAPYFRLVMHLDRIWDYSSCPEAQLKTWLARHLIAEANPRCSMWGSSAAADAVPGADGWSEGDRAAAAAAGLRPLGPYSCSLADAEAVLHRLWQSSRLQMLLRCPCPTAACCVSCSQQTRTTKWLQCLAAAAGAIVVAAAAAVCGWGCGCQRSKRCSTGDPILLGLVGAVEFQQSGTLAVALLPQQCSSYTLV